MMMILNQSKTMIVNIDNISVIATNDAKSGTKILATEVGDDPGAYVIGKYKTRTRTNEVLREIFEKMKTTGFDFTYEMPKE